MRKNNRSITAPENPDSSGRHGGNRAGRGEKEELETGKSRGRSSQSAGKDPHRGEKEKRPGA